VSVNRMNNDFGPHERRCMSTTRQELSKALLEAAFVTAEKGEDAARNETFGHAGDDLDARRARYYGEAALRFTQAWMTSTKENER
jgi:hypothetical protein